MPGGDRTGPLGAGPRTGRAAGFCAGYGMPGYANPVGGYGYGRGFGRGFRGRGWGGGGVPYWGADPYVQPRYFPPYEENVAVVDEIEQLKSQEKHFSDVLKGLRNRIEKLERKKESTTEE